MNGTIDDRYFEWLYSKVGSVRNRNPAHSYWELLRKLYTTAFDPRVPNDDNRAEDGKALRDEFSEETGTRLEYEWRRLDCSMLEMLIGLSQRASFETGMEPAAWFWKLLENIGLRNYSDDIYEIAIDEEVGEVLSRINERTYERDGQGGLFPLQIAHKDQRKLELWYQLSAYLLEGRRVANGPQR